MQLKATLFSSQKLKKTKSLSTYFCKLLNIWKNVSEMLCQGRAIVTTIPTFHATLSVGVKETIFIQGFL